MAERARLTRRRLLAGLGLAAPMAYAAPAIFRLGEARASGGSASGPDSRSFSAPEASPPLELVLAVSPDADLAALAAHGFRVVEAAISVSLGLRLARVVAPLGVGMEAARAQLSALLPGAIMDRNTRYAPSEFACGADGCAAFDAIEWDGVPCSATARIGMIDTGVNAEHEALKGQAVELVPLSDGARAASGRTHGTAIAALLVGRRDSRVPGLLPDAELVAVDAFFSEGGTDVADAYGVVRALDLLAQRTVRVINTSLAGPANAVLEQAVREIARRDIAIVAAAGNEGPGAEPQFPAGYADVVAVTAVDRSQQVYRMAGTGPHIAFAAPGVRLWTAASVEGGRFRSGTSYAVPFVTAAIAAGIAARPDSTTAEVVADLSTRAADLGEPGRDPVFGWGLLRAAALCGAMS